MDSEQVLVLLARLEERQGAAERALELNRLEIHRRLEILNGEAARLHNMQMTYVPRETFDTNVDAIEKATRIMETSLDARLKMLENANANLAGRTWIGGAVVLILAALISAVIPRIR
jgi:hypothetical protein